MDPQNQGTMACLYMVTLSSKSSLPNSFFE